MYNPGGPPPGGGTPMMPGGAPVPPGLPNGAPFPPFPPGPRPPGVLMRHMGTIARARTLLDKRKYTLCQDALTPRVICILEAEQRMRLRS
eukprot:1158554-Pelagomonas_calceolata.AAC.4